MLLIKNKNSDKKHKRYIPSAFLIIFGLIFAFIIVSWIGKMVGASTQIWVAKNGTVQAHFENVKIVGLGFLDTLVAVWKGFASRAEIILFIICIGGMLGILTKTKAMDAGIDRIITRLKGKEIWIIPVLMALFGLGGSTYGMWEETIAFFPVLIPIFIRAGYGPLTAVMVILLGAGTGCLASTVNPFAVSVAFSSADSAHGSFPIVHQSTGMGSRWVSFVIFQSIAICFVTFIAKRIKAGKMKIVGIDNNKINKKFPQKNETINFNWRRKLAISTFILGFILMIVSFLPWASFIGQSKLDHFNSLASKDLFWLASTSGGWAPWGEWYFISVTGIFFLVSLIVFAFNMHDFVETDNNKEQVFIRTFVKGSGDVLQVCLIIAVAGGLGFILKTSHVGPWIANSMKGISSIGIVGYGILMFIVALILSFVMPSTSGFAAAFMPIFGGVAFTAFQNHQGGAIAMTVMAFIFASGIINLIAPTSAALMAYTAYAEIPYPVWIKKIWPVVAIFLVISIIILAIFGFMAANDVLF